MEEIPPFIFRVKLIQSALKLIDSGVSIVSLQMSTVSYKKEEYKYLLGLKEFCCLSFMKRNRNVSVSRGFNRSDKKKKKESEKSTVRNMLLTLPGTISIQL